MAFESNFLMKRHYKKNPHELYYCSPTSDWNYYRTPKKLERHFRKVVKTLFPEHEEFFSDWKVKRFNNRGKYDSCDPYIGLCDKESKTIWVREDERVRPIQWTIIIAHELCHALTDIKVDHGPDFVNLLASAGDRAFNILTTKQDYEIGDRWENIQANAALEFWKGRKRWLAAKQGMSDEEILAMSAAASLWSDYTDIGCPFPVLKRLKSKQTP